MKKYFLFLMMLAVLQDECGAQVVNTNTLLWRIDGGGNTAPSYLFGTMHLPQKKFVIYSDSVYEAIRNSTILYNEVDFLNPSIFMNSSMMEFMQEKTEHFDSIRKTKNWEIFIGKINRQYGKNIHADNLDEFLEFSQDLMKSLYTPDKGMSMPDIMLAGLAVALGKKTGGLETFELQYNMLYDILDARLTDTTMQMSDETDLTNSLKEMYVKEQLDSMTIKILSINPTYRQIVFDNRNKTMTDSIQKHSAEMSCFFAVGAGHLCGPSGIIALLRQNGYRVTPVYSPNKISLIVISDIVKQAGRSGKEKEGTVTDDVKIDVLKDEGEEVEPPPPPPYPPPPDKVDIKPVKKKKKP